MIVPTVHLNGTGKQTLLDELCEAGYAVQKAITALPTPNARDYYVQGDQAYSQAMKEHFIRCNKLLEVWEELGELAEKIADQE